MQTAALILAAGASTRLGHPKQLVTLNPQPGSENLLARAIRVATKAGCTPVLVILGFAAEDIARETRLLPIQFLINAAWPEGLASSIRLGIAAIQPHAGAAILMTCDQPAVTPEHLQRLMSLAPDEVVASSYAQKRGVPAYFPGTRFQQLLLLRGDTGARHLLAPARAVDLDRGELDVDTPEALAFARAISTW